MKGFDEEIADLQDIYAQGRETLVEEGSLNAEDDAFMRGWEGAFE